MSEARRQFTAKLLTDLLDVVSDENRAYATLAISAIAREIHELEREARAAAQPDVELARMKKALDVELDGMLRAFSALSEIAAVPNH